MGVHSFKDMQIHVEHKLRCVQYGDVNVAIECLDCNEVLVDFDAADEEDETE